MQFLTNQNNPILVIYLIVIKTLIRTSYSHYYEHQHHFLYTYEHLSSHLHKKLLCSYQYECSRQNEHLYSQSNEHFGALLKVLMSTRAF